jgi:hypothetical protein
MVRPHVEDHGFGSGFDDRHGGMIMPFWDIKGIQTCLFRSVRSEGRRWQYKEMKKKIKGEGVKKILFSIL